jgi:hypothetical protein
MNDPTSIWSGLTAPLAPLNRSTGTHGVQQLAKVLDVRLRRRISQDRRPLGQRGRHDGILRARHARLVQKDLFPTELAAQHELVTQLHLGPELLQRIEMCVQPSATDHVAAGRRQHHLAHPRQHRAGQQDRGTNPGDQVGLERCGVNVSGVQRQRTGARPLEAHAERFEQLEHGMHVPDIRYIRQLDRLIREQRRRHHRQSGVLVPRRPHMAVQDPSAFNYEAAHGWPTYTATLPAVNRSHHA